jgi:hypothetical protein
VRTSNTEIDVTTGRQIDPSTRKIKKITVTAKMQE